MPFVIDRLQARPNALRIPPGRTRLTVWAYAIPQATEVTITYSIARQWKVWFRTGGGQSKRLSFRAHLSNTLDDIRRSVTLERGAGQAVPEKMKITGIVQDDSGQRVLKSTVVHIL